MVCNQTIYRYPEKIVSQNYQNVGGNVSRETLYSCNVKINQKMFHVKQLYIDYKGRLEGIPSLRGNLSSVLFFFSIRTLHLE